MADELKSKQIFTLTDYIIRQDSTATILDAKTGSYSKSFVVPHPDPTNSIEIIRAISELHVQAGRYTDQGSLKVEISRVSDGALIATALINSALGTFGKVELLVEPGFFLLTTSDSLSVTVLTIGSTSKPVQFSSRIVLVYKHHAPKFVQLFWEHDMQDQFVGLKEDGSVWRAPGGPTDPVPLQWTRVY
jgi:hypothetical protein